MAKTLCSYTPSTATPTPSGGSCGLRPTCSMASLGSRATLRSLSPPAPPSAGHGPDGKQRRFSSRHVPSVAEEIVHSEVMNPSIARRFTGLMRYLKKNSVAEDQQKSVLQLECAEQLIPEEYEDALRSEYERRCAFGERMNTELMSSAKWVKLLRDLKAISSAGTKAGGVVTEGGSPTMTLAEADIIFHKVLHNCDHGGQRLTYELFCKAISIAGQVLRPTLEGEAAITEIVSQIVANAPEEPQGAVGENPDFMLDANVLLVLDHFKPALHDLFDAFCSRNLSNPAAASHGTGTVRIRERTIWRHTQEKLMSTYMSKATSTSGRGGFEEPSRFDGFSMACSPKADAGSTAVAQPSKDVQPAGQEAEGQQVTEGHGGAYNGNAAAHTPTLPITNKMAVAPAGSPLPRVTGTPVDSDRGPILAWAESRGWQGLGEARALPQKPCGTSGTWKKHDEFSVLSASPHSTMMSGSTGMSQKPKDPYLYANGAPVIRDRRQNMSSSQLLAWCKELQIMPDLLTRLEVVRIFKRAQSTGVLGHGTSLYGYLSKEAFVDAVGQLAIEAYSKEPFCEEYPEAHEKIHAFLLNYLPQNSREAHDRFLYGTSGRGR